MKKIMTIIAAALVALTFVGCQMADLNKDLNAKQAGTKKNLTVSVSYPGPGAKYQRGWKQLGNKETVQALETKITIDTSNTTGYVTESADKKTYTKADADATGKIAVNAVVGLIFDLHETKKKETVDGKEVTNKYYDFVLIGYQPTNKQYYIERYVDIPAKAFSEATSDSAFADASTFITDTKTTFFYNPVSDKNNPSPDQTKAKAYVTETNGKLPKSEEDGAEEGKTAVALQTLTIKITQEVKGTYVIDLGDGKTWEYKPEANADWTNKEGYRIGGAGYYVNCPVGLSTTAHFNSKKDNTIGLNADEEEFESF